MTRVYITHRWMMTVAVVLNACGMGWAASYDDAATGNYSANATWGGASNPGGGSVADTVAIDGYTVTATAIGDTSNDTISVSSPGILKIDQKSVAPADYNGATINLGAGGKVSSRNGNTSSAVYYGGDFKVTGDNSVLEALSGQGPGGAVVQLYHSLSFATGGNLAVTVSQPAANMHSYLFFTNGITATESGVVHLSFMGGGCMKHLFPGPLTVAANKTLAFTGGNTNLSIAVGGSPGYTTDFGSDQIRLHDASAISGAVSLSGVELRVVTAGALGSGRVIAGTNGVVTCYDLANSFGSGSTQATLELDGGAVVSCLYNDGNNIVYGGNVKVRSGGGTINCGNTGGSGQNGASTFNSLEFTGTNNPVVVMKASRVDGAWDYANRSTTFANGVTMTQSGVMDIISGSYVEAAGLTVYAGSVLTKTGAQELKVTGTVNVGLAGSVGLLTNTALRLVTRTAGTLTQTSATIQTCGGLWSKSGDTNKIDAVIAKTNGVMDATGQAQFSEEDAGCIEIQGLVAESDYRFRLDLGAFDSGKSAATVAAEIARNSRFTQVVGDEGSACVTFVMRSPVTGTGWFVWDNHPDSINNLGANVMGLRPPPKGTVISVQ